MALSTSDASSLPTLNLFGRLGREMPQMFQQAQVVGKWVWLEFNLAPSRPIRDKLEQLGFHWNAGRKCWQHQCGVSAVRSGGDPRSYYPETPAPGMALNDAPAAVAAKEYKVIALRECPLPESLGFCDTPDRAAEYWRLSPATKASWSGVSPSITPVRSTLFWAIFLWGIASIRFAIPLVISD